MKTRFPKSRWFGGLLYFAILPLPFVCSIPAIAGISTVTASEAPPNPADVRIQFSAGVSEILKMIDAKVEGSVILAYIDSSPTAYSPTASEIIILKDRGVSPELIAAMLKHGGDVRARATASPAAPAQPPPNATASYAPSQDYAPAPPAYSDYGYPSSSVSYYSYGYPSYSYSYPWYGYSPALYFGYYPYHHYYYHRYPSYHRYPYNSYGHFGYGNRFTAYRTPPRPHGGFRSVASPRAPAVIGTHGSGFRGGTIGGGFRGGSVRGGGGFTGHGGSHMGGRMR